MRRRGTYVICDVCGNSMFLKNLKRYPAGGWKYVRKLKADICPRCVSRRSRLIEQGNTNLSWDEILTMSLRKKSDDILVS